MVTDLKENILNLGGGNASSPRCRTVILGTPRNRIVERRLHSKRSPKTNLIRFARPCAPGVSDPRHDSLPSCPSSLFFPSSFLPFFLLPSSLFPLRPDPYVLGRERAHMGRRQGELARQTPGFFGVVRLANFVLKSLCFFMPFSSILGRFWIPRWLQNPPKSVKHRLQNRTWFWSRFRHHFLKNCVGFSTPADSKNVPKTTEGCSFLHFSCFLLRLSSESDFGPSWGRFLRILGTISEDFSHQRRD